MYTKLLAFLCFSLTKSVTVFGSPFFLVRQKLNILVTTKPYRYYLYYNIVNAQAAVDGKSRGNERRTFPQLTLLIFSPQLIIVFIFPQRILRITTILVRGRHLIAVIRYECVRVIICDGIVTADFLFYFFNVFIVAADVPRQQ